MTDDTLAGGIWITTDNVGMKCFPEWKRRCFWMPDGQVFMPAAIFLNEQIAVLYASFGGTEMIFDEDHLYLPSDWIARELPVLSMTT